METKFYMLLPKLVIEKCIEILLVVDILCF